MRPCLLTVSLLQGCTISGGFGVHPTSYDYYMRTDPVVAFAEAEMELTDNIGLYARHESLPFDIDDEKGLNTVGVKGRITIK